MIGISTASRKLRKISMVVPALFPVLIHRRDEQFPGAERLDLARPVDCEQFRLCFATVRIYVIRTVFKTNVDGHDDTL